MGLKKALKSFLPGYMRFNSEVQGMLYMVKIMFRMAWSYRRTLFYLLRKKGLKAAWNFIYVKVFVPTGEGAGAAAYFLIGPLIKKFPALAPLPRYVEFEMTTVCNKKCIMCEHTYWDEPSVHLSFEQFKHIADQIPLKWVNLTGEGDSFLNKDFVKIIEYLKKKDVCVYFVDSFDFLDEKQARSLVELGVDGIYTSFDAATKETFERIKVGCSFDRSINNLKTIIQIKKELKSPIPDQCFRFVITTENYKEMPQFLELVRSLGAPKDIGDGARVEYAGLLEFPEIAQYKLDKVPNEIIEDTIMTSKKTRIPAYFAHSEDEHHPPLEHCIAWMEPYIMMGGYVQPCCAVLMSNKRDYLREHALGNVFQQSFKDIWYSDRYKRFRNLINKPIAKVPLLCLNCRAYSTKEREKKYGIAYDL